jgi:predicted metal-dependent TIM-barrel fold hydrolase
LEKEKNTVVVLFTPHNIVIDDEEYCVDLLYDKGLDDDSILFDDHPSQTMVSTLWEDVNDSNAIHDP